LQYFNNRAFDSVITELKSKPTRSEIKTDTGFCSLDVQQDNMIAFENSARPYTAKQQSETHRIIMGQKYLFVMREQIHAHHIPFH
jgi:hypothetical protein